MQPVRSESRRRARAKTKRFQYRRNDKAAQIAALTEQQGGVCAVCREPGHARGDGTAGLVLDHCHSTGAPRAMLCGRCNAALGLLREDSERIAALLRYAHACDRLRRGEL